jgi:hypothetical protein
VRLLRRPINVKCLDGHPATEHGILGDVHDTHAAFAEFFDNPIVRDSAPDHESMLSATPLITGLRKLGTPAAVHGKEIPAERAVFCGKLTAISR